MKFKCPVCGGKQFEGWLFDGKLFRVCKKCNVVVGELNQSASQPPTAPMPVQDPANAGAGLDAKVSTQPDAPGPGASA